MKGNKAGMQDFDKELIKRAASGDMQAFEEIYKTYSKYVYNLLLRFFYNQDDAQEITQEVFMKVYENLNKFRFKSKLKTWIYRISINVAQNFNKKENKNKGNFAAYDDTLVIKQNNSVDQLIEKEYHEKVIKRLLDEITPEQKSCLVLRTFEKLSYQEISGILEVDVNTVRSRLKRAREKLLSLRKEVVVDEL